MERAGPYHNKGKGKGKSKSEDKGKGKAKGKNLEAAQEAAQRAWLSTLGKGKQPRAREVIGKLMKLLETSSESECDDLKEEEINKNALNAMKLKHHTKVAKLEERRLELLAELNSIANSDAGEAATSSSSSNSNTNSNVNSHSDDAEYSNYLPGDFLWLLG